MRTFIGSGSVSPSSSDHVGKLLLRASPSQQEGWRAQGSSRLRATETHSASCSTAQAPHLTAFPMRNCLHQSTIYYVRF
ncbi:hypothetical protein AMECASPLE_034991 [Ameca splendens]|uniref:Uncharacterized protein n=1 Tax=Ameca splendens TaxID=208324 RepID=A0ABV0XK97_9TELE